MTREEYEDCHGNDHDEEPKMRRYKVKIVYVFDVEATSEDEAFDEAYKTISDIDCDFSEYEIKKVYDDE